MANVPLGSQAAAYWYPDLYRHDVSQRLAESFGGVPSIEIACNKIEYINGVMSRLAQSFYDISTFTKEITIDTFNPDDNEFKAFKTSVESVKYLPYTVPFKELVTIAQNAALKEAFAQGRHKAARNTLSYYFFAEKMKCLLDITNDYFPTASAKWYYDFEKAWTGAMTTENAGVRIEEVREYIDSLATPSITHIAPKGDFNDAAEQAKWFYSSGDVSNLVMIVDNKFNNKSKTLFSTLLNKDDAVVKIKKIVIDFTKIPGFSTNTAAVRTKKSGATTAAAGTVKKNKIDCIILDKRAFEMGLWIDDMVHAVTLPKGRILYEHIFGYTFNRIRLFPIAVFGRT